MGVGTRRGFAWIWPSGWEGSNFWYAHPVMDPTAALPTGAPSVPTNWGAVVSVVLAPMRTYPTLPPDWSTFWARIALPTTATGRS